MRTLASEAAPDDMSRAEAHVRAGEQWLLAEEPAEAAAEVRAETGRTDPRTCDMVAEVLIEQGDLTGALDWATAGVDSSLRNNDRDELPLLLRLRFRLRVDLGLGEDDYDRLLDTKVKTPRPRPAVP